MHHLRYCSGMVAGAKVCLTSEFVDALLPPERGEIWIGDNHLDHFGIRAWSGKGGGNKAFAIRLRDKSGKLVRETFRRQHNTWYVLIRGWEKSEGYFLEQARHWAWDRIAFHQGRPSRREARQQLQQRQGRRILKTKLGDAFGNRLRQLRKRSRNPTHLDQIEELINQYIPSEVLDTTLGELSENELAKAVADHGMGYGNLRRLRAFIAGMLKERSRVHTPLGTKLELFQQHCRNYLDSNPELPFPAILKIAAEDFQKFFGLLDDEPSWRQALALRLYFATGARMQQVLRARWSDIVGQEWFPFTPDDRKLWFEASQSLDSEALSVLDRIAAHHNEEGIQSLFLFPSIDKGPAHPIRTVQRMWSRTRGTMCWNDLPLSHIVWRHRPRTTPSYHLVFSRTYFSGLKAKEGRAAVSKVRKRCKQNNVFSNTYMIERKPT